MKKRLLLVCGALICAIMLWFTGHLILPAGTQGGAYREVSDADTLYLDSLTSIRTATDIMLNISMTRETIVGNAVFTETSQQWLSYLELGTENMRAALNETLTIGDHRTEITEIYSGGTGYITVNGIAFSGAISPEDYQNRFAPAILLDPSRYQTITGFDTRKNYIIQFTQPVEAEAWALKESASVIEAEGTAYVSYEGQLTGSTYTLTYQQGNAQIRLTYTVDVEPISTNITLPEDTAKYQVIDYLDGPRMLEQTTGYLLLADYVSAKYSDDIYCQTFGDHRTQEITLHATLAEQNNWSALVQTQTNLTNESKAGTDSNFKKTELFKDGIYRSATNDGEWVNNGEVTADTMHTYCKNQLIGTVMLPQYITGAQIEEAENTIRIVFSGSESFAPLICSNICQTLYQKPELLNDMAQSNTTNTLQCYLELDRKTSLPIASGINYDGSFYVEGVPYVLRFKADQIYDIPSGSAQAEIDKAGA